MDVPVNNLEEESWNIKHMVDVKSIRFLYTK